MTGNFRGIKTNAVFDTTNSQKINANFIIYNKYNQYSC